MKKLNWKYLLPIGLVIWIISSAIKGIFSEVVALIGFIIFVLGIFSAIRSICKKKIETEDKNIPKSHKMTGFIKRWSKEIVIALALAMVAAIVVDNYKKSQEKQILENNKKAVATIVVEDKDNKPIGQGSGVFINSTGELITNYHVIENYAFILAKLPSGAYYQLKDVKYTNKDYDVAVLQFDANETPYAVGLGDSDKIYAGETVTAIGTPQGMENSVSTGVISNPKQDPNRDGKNYIQFTAPISSGSSGGGLFDSKGKIIGLTSDSIISDKNSFAQNINFAVPINVVKDTMNGQEQQLSEGSAQYYYWLGSLADEKSDYDTAIKNYTKAISIDNTLDTAYYGLGWDYYYKGDFDQELQNFDKALQLDPKDSDYLYAVGGAYEDKGEYDKAISYYQQALAIDPSDKDTLDELIVIYLSKGLKKDAAQSIQKLIDLDPGYAKVYQNVLNGMK